MYCAVHDYDSWRDAARELIRARVEPAAVTWGRPGGQQDLLQQSASPPSARRSPAGKGGSVSASPAVTTPPAFAQIAREVACHRAPDNWGLLYSVLWRIQFENRALLDHAADAQVSRLQKLSRQVHRDYHKMKAFVRFQRVAQPPVYEEPATEQFVSWFEPSHRIVRMTAPFFARRFPNMRWSILTPDECAHWDGGQLQYSAGLGERPNLRDDWEALWRTYYRHIFNPARLKPAAMQAEMPKKYWKNLPEAGLIPQLMRDAEQQTAQMITRPAEEGWRKTARSAWVQAQQRKLRER